MNRRLFLSRAGASVSIGAAAIVGLTPKTALASSRLSTIVVDAGHGGHDTGANSGRVFEKHLNLDVSRRLEIQLRRRGYKTVMTRDRDEFIPLLTRSQIANRHRSSIFVSIHFNWGWRSSAAGIETFYYSYTGYKVASKIHGSIVRKLRPEDRGVKRGKFSVLRNTKAPAILVEGGFISNTEERKRMLQAWYRQALAESIASGISIYDRSA
ncbi:MAG: N-acetylmuramoyl-L-alanine amidase [Verrucomicrobiota bacterium]